jgi:anaerobic nitric oxide reductase transcription regulator
MSKLMDADLVSLACDLTTNLAEHDRYNRLLAAVQRLIPCDAATIMRLDGDALVPLAFSGLVPELAGRRFRPQEHPRLSVILGRLDNRDVPTPVRFSPDSGLPDPFDGLMLVDPHACARVHACMGCPLMVQGTVIGVLTVDALNPNAFADISDATIAGFAALAAASLHTAHLIDVLERGAERRDAVLRHLVRNEGAKYGARLLGVSPAMQRLRAEIDLVAGSDLPVLITGETGVGKELVAGAIHAGGRRANEPLVQMNCAALPESLAESELFGHLRGAFTGATSDRPGKFEIADGGTLFLDEVGELPLSVQAKLLRAVQQGEVQRVGADRVLHVEVRIIAATNRDLPNMGAQGRFRDDLYHRLAVYPIHVPPLRDRREDIAIIAGQVLEREAVRMDRAHARLDAAARKALESYDWPGNVRELEHVLARALLRAARSGASGRDAVVRIEHLGLGEAANSSTDATHSVPAARGVSLRQRLDAAARHEVLTTLRRHNNSWTSAARELAVTASNLQRLAKRLGIDA